MDCLNHALCSFVIVRHIYNFYSWRGKYKNLVLTGKTKWDNSKHFLLLTRKTPFFTFYIFSHFFNQKLFICIHQLSNILGIHLRLCMYANENDTILSSSNITYWKSNNFLGKVQSALCWWNTTPLNLNLC